MRLGDIGDVQIIGAHDNPGHAVTTQGRLDAPPHQRDSAHWHEVLTRDALGSTSGGDQGQSGCVRVLHQNRKLLIGEDGVGSVHLPPLLMTRPDVQRLGVPVTGMLAHRSLPQLLAPAELVIGVGACRRERPDALLAWGRRPSADRVERLGKAWGLPVWHLEDGFLRSLGKTRDQPPLCLLVDDLGVHIDATAASRLEQLIATPLTPSQQQRARAVQRLWCEQRLSKLNLQGIRPHRLNGLCWWWISPQVIDRSAWGWRGRRVFNGCCRLRWRTTLTAPLWSRCIRM